VALRSYILLTQTTRLLSEKQITYTRSLKDLGKAHSIKHYEEKMKKREIYIVVGYMDTMTQRDH